MKPVMKPVLLLFTMLCCLAPAHAAPAGSHGTDHDIGLTGCDASLSPLRMSDCAFDNLQVSQIRLDKLIARYRQRLTTDQQQLFQLGQAQWKDYVIRSCEFEASAAAGRSAYPTIIALCRTRLTEQRRMDILRWARCQAGNLNCPAPDPDSPDQDD